MRDAQPSRTAVRAAILRAAHQILDDDPKILNDEVVVRLVRGFLWEDLESGVDGFHPSLMRRLRATFVLRSRYAEDVLKEVASRGVGQYVILGAGLDTFAYRQPPWAWHLRIFEVDHPATQQWKREALQVAEVPIPDNLRFCPADFEIPSLRQALQTVAFEYRTATFLSWLGVTQYLTEAAIGSTLEFVLSLPAGSGIVFSFIVADTLLDLDRRRDSAAVAIRAASVGEPWITRFEPADLRRWLLEMGFAQVQLLTPEWADQLYFSRRRDGLEAPRETWLIRAVV